MSKGRKRGLEEGAEAQHQREHRHKRQARWRLAASRALPRCGYGFVVVAMAKKEEEFASWIS